MPWISRSGLLRNWPSKSPTETSALARALAIALLQVGDGKGWVVSLNGPLGAGKTHFAKALAEGLGIDPARVSSPTFVIANEYEAAREFRLVHADWYRVESEDELMASGLHDWLAPGVGLVVEWGDRFPEALPEDRLEVELRPGEAIEDRQVCVTAAGPVSRAALERWSAACP
ncbi:MAG: tRNA (adenosine(37)-N6)-threonylcarbamoyltransferase complex ATPase subunit type 1 TsaE [Deltaproteobacteria bacterium]|nr:tRNA (adenosine(37)-N6)-threonylcarbamoyltransferase complex ATPase subunit type 1 TsaE [Deltaproteobacteria bacterium]MBW2394730.1 tRNA (adenosine(37)-N6)-threonylcarbamoyltransferase complex ATPase subunit type 1 TsaE [Deltaproteobacteria bacterium]